MPGSFQKSYKTGKQNVSVTRAVVNYSENTMQCKVKFTAETPGNMGYHAYNLGYHGLGSDY